MIHLSDTFIDQVMKQFFERPYEPLPVAASTFKYWHEHHPKELEHICSEVEVDIKDLEAGDVLSAVKVMMERKDPLELLVDFFKDPLVRIRAREAKKVAPETYKAFKAVNLEKFVRDISSLDIHIFTHNLIRATQSTLQLFGFVPVEDFWEASLGMHPLSRQRFSHPDEFGTRIKLPFDHFTYVSRFSRGLEEMTLTAHHRTAELAREGTYFARTLLGNTRILDELPVLTEQETRLRYGMAERDPLTMAFRDGFIVKTGHVFAYHPRLLIEALTKKLEDREHLYFFMRAVGVPPDNAEMRRDLKERLNAAEIELMKMQFGQTVPEFDMQEPKPIEEVELYLHDLKAKVDVSMYLPILRTENARRLRGVKSLGNLYHLRIPYAMQSRLEHSIGVMHMARILCNRFKIPDKDRLKVEVYALTHDSGHLTGSHATEDYFKAMCGFDHDKFAVELLRQNKSAFEGIVDIEDIVAMFEHRDPLHAIVDGPFGADRIYYLSIDPDEYGLKNNFDPSKLMTWLAWKDEKVFVEQYAEGAFEFLDFRAKQYEELYFSPSTQIADAYQKKMLFKAKILDHFQKINVQHTQSLDERLQEGVNLEFWRFSDVLLQHTLWHHSDREVKEIMRHLVTVYHKSPHASVSVLKLKGFENSEPQVDIPLYPWLKYINVPPYVEGVDPEKLAKYNGLWRDPRNQSRLEHEIARKSGIPERHIIVASVPNMQKLSSEYAPVRVGDEIKSLFDCKPEYRQPFIDRANRMACLRVAVHPQLYPMAYEFFKHNSLAKIVEEVYG